MKRFTKLIAMMTAVVTMSSMLAGCGSSQATTTDTVVQTGSETTATSTEYDDDATIVWGLTSQWADMTPFDNGAGGYYSGIFNTLVYDKLVYCKMDGSIEPRAAESWEVSEDKTVFTFHLNPNSKFHDGKPATASDWVFTAKLLAKAESGFSDHSSAMSIIAGTDDTGEMLSEEEFGFKALDDTILEITLKNPMNESTFLTSYSFYYTCLPEHILGSVDPVGIASSEFFTEPVGSGPCKFTSLVAGSELVLDRFTDYPIGDAHYSKMVFKMMSTSALATALMSGEIDIPYVTVSTDEALQLQGSENINVIKTEKAESMTFIAINNQRITDVRVRQAVNYAIDKELIGTQLQQGLGTPIETFFTFDSEYVPDTIKYEFNLDKAKELLDAAKADGYDGKFVIATPSGTRERVCALIEQNLESIGFEVEIQVLEATTMFADLRKGAEGTYDAGVVGMGISPDPCYFDTQLDYRTAGFGSVTDEKYVEYQNQFVAAKTEEEAKTIMAEYLEYVHEQCPYIFLTGTTGYRTFSTRVGDVNDDYGAISLRDMGVWDWKVSK